MIDDLTRFVDAHLDEVYAIGPVDDAEIKAAEAALGYSLPEGVRTYVQRYGTLSYGSVEFYGLGVRPTSHLHLVQRTLALRSEAGFPKDAVLLEDLGDGHYAVCTLDGSVLNWASPSPIGEPKSVAASAQTYMLQRLQDA